MNPYLRGRVAELRAEGPRRFSRWDATLFDSAVTGPAEALARHLDGQPDADGLLLSYFVVIQQAVGTGVLKQTGAGAAGWSSLLERLLVETAPARLPAVRADRRQAVLAEVWNLGEGLLREPAWVDRYVNACAGNLTRIDELERFLVQTLDPVLTPPLPASWSGPLRLSVLDLRLVHDEFLPGRLRLAAPTVLCVEDRREPGRQVAVSLRRGQGGKVLGVVTGLGEYRDPGPLPAVEFEDERVKVTGRGAQAVRVPTLRRCHAFAVARGGFVAACAADSQRLWVFESD